MSVKISERNRLFKRNIFSWQSVRDALEGTNAVKLANELYLPMPAGFEQDSTAPSSAINYNHNLLHDNSNDLLNVYAPWYHSNPAYMAYLHRARFPEITIHTLRGLIGIATRKKMEITLPDKLSYLEENATNKGNSLEELFVFCLTEVLGQGRITLVIDINENDNTLYISPYSAERFINWDNSETTGETTFAVFEQVEKRINKKTEIEEKTINIVYMLMLNEEKTGLEVHVKKMLDDIEISPEVIPSLQGTQFEGLPIVTIGSVVNSNDPNPAPLLGVSEIAYSIYRKDADLSNAEYMTCNPIFTISGASAETGVPLSFGSQIALLLENPDAKAYFPATDTSALDHVAKRIADLFAEAAHYGAMLIGPEKKAVEAFETVKARQGAQSATLIGVIDNVVKGINDVLTICAKISGLNDDSAFIEVDTDFAERQLSPQMLTALVNSWIGGALSKETLHTNMKKSGILNRDEDIAEESIRIENEGPAISGE